jgi:thermitase
VGRKNVAYEYKVLGQTVKLDVDPSVVAVRFQTSAPNSALSGALDTAGAGPFSRRFEIPGEDLTIVPAAPAGPGPAGVPSPETAERAIEALRQRPEVEQALPVFRVNGNQVVATERVIVGLDDPSNADVLAAAHQLTLLRRDEDRAVFAVPSGRNPFEVSAALDGQPGVRFAEPDFVTIGRHIPQRVAPAAPPVLNDPLLVKQYAMHLTRAADVWQEHTGDAAVRIAVLDEGVDTRHPDLRTALVATFDAADGDSYQEPNTWDGHGTACAGLAAAVGGNAIGIRGVAAGCSLMGVRIAFSQFQGGPWVTSNLKIADAIAWSWRNGAAVISNSWGGGAPSNEIAEQFEKARTRGRSGRGCVIVIAAGNDFGPVNFPGTLPNVLTVSASNQYDEAKTPSSKDGEHWWGTCHGPEIDVAAPGVANLTTDNSGVAGYDGGDYAERFNGTSSATPLVAGACALVLSVAPNLRENEVRDIIRQSAGKVGPYPYSNGRNDFFGYGRLDVLAAVRLARRQSAVAGAGLTAAQGKDDPGPQPASAIIVPPAAKDVSGVEPV